MTKGCFKMREIPFPHVAIPFPRIMPSSFSRDCLGCRTDSMPTFRKVMRRGTRFPRLGSTH